MKRILLMTTLMTASAAGAETQLNSTQLEGLLTSQTVYLTTPGGEAVIHFRSDATSFAKLPNGHQMTGRWEITDAGYCVDWENGPQNSCTRVMRSDAGMHMIDDATGDPRGQIARIVPGNPEEF